MFCGGFAAYSLYANSCGSIEAMKSVTKWLKDNKAEVQE